MHKQRQALQEVLRDAQAELTKRAHDIAETNDKAERLERQLRDQTTESGSQEERMGALRGELEEARKAARVAKDAYVSSHILLIEHCYDDVVPHRRRVV